MKILICGLPKSGTTILTYRIARALGGPVEPDGSGRRRPEPGSVHIDFEPPGPPDPDAAPEGQQLVTKKLIGAHTTDLGPVERYDRRIWIARDPRDFLVSQGLYRWHRESTERPDGEEQTRFEALLSMLRAKEADPASVPFTSLGAAHYFETFEAVADLAATVIDDGWFRFRYEDMVEGRYEALNAHLGFPVEREAEVDPGFDRVARSKAAGDWRHWFTDDDVAFYRAGRLDRYMDEFGYDRDDWRLADPQHIDPEHASEYVRWLFLHEAAGRSRHVAGAVPAAGPVGDTIGGAVKG